MAKGAILDRFDHLLAALPTYAQIRTIHLTLEPWTVGNGLLTTTQKVRRHAIQERFADAIERLYQGHGLEA